jgi:hypothetical protein
MRFLLFLVFVIGSISTFGQEIEVEYDKTRDLSKYKTFAITEGEIITPKDKRKIDDAKLHEWVREAVAGELKDKGLTHLDSLADLTVTYLIGSLERSDLQNLGPGGMAPGSSDRTWSRDYEQSSFIIDLNDRSNILVWRINGVTSTSSPNAANMIDEVVAKGFKKFSLKPKKEKKKKD